LNRNLNLSKRNLLRLAALVMSLVFSMDARATRVHGKVFTDRSLPLPFATILVSGTTTGTTANSSGEYFIDVTPGEHVLIARHVGYATEEVKVLVGTEPLLLNFVLKEQQLTLEQVNVKAGAEDPAYAIIREAIRKRPIYHQTRTAYQCMVYTKGQIRLDSYPKTFFGQRIDFGDGGPSANKMIYLSETQARYTVEPPDKQKTEVISTRVSGQSNGFGFSNPQVIDFYSNNVQVTRNLNPRGFISPIADGAMNFYRYKYMGAFFENGRQVNKIQVIPKRTYEPLFSGFINITENDWHIHSLQLELTKASQIEFVDKIRIEQIHMPMQGDLWLVQSQTVFPVVSFMGFKGNGYFVSVFSDHVLQPAVPKGFFDRTIIRYDPLSNKRDSNWWSANRPIPLLPAEVEDYRKKDSLERLRQDPHVMDSLDHIQNRITPVGLLLNGQTLSRRSRKTTFTYDPLLKAISFNTAEGWTLQFSGDWTKHWEGRRRLTVTPLLRYGLHNGHFNPYLITEYRYGKGYLNSISVSGGKRVFQFNNDNPIPQVLNTWTTLQDGHNYMKTYEATALAVQYTRGVGEGFTIKAGISYQHRRPLENTDTTSYWGRHGNRENLTPNFPVEIVQSNIPVHNALVLSAEVSYQPGSRYIELPDTKINLGSRYPLFSLFYARGLRMLGGAISYDRWRFSVKQNVNFHLPGEFRYNIEMGGFLSKARLEAPDYIHFTGNQTTKAVPYLGSFQLLPYYARSGTYDFYTALHAEHHFNGFLTNKIPLVKKLNLRLVGGANLLWVNGHDHYLEAFAGIDNIFKIFRLDYVWAWDQHGAYAQGIRIGIYAFGNLFTDQ
jgi:hypothetical protein